MLKKLLLIALSSFILVSLVGTNAMGGCIPLPSGVPYCRHEVCVPFNYRAMKADTSAVCLSVFWEQMQGGICINPADQEPPDHPADDDSEFYPTDISSTVANLVCSVDAGGKYQLVECWDPCQELLEAEFNPCNNNWEFSCDEENYPVNSVTFLTWSSTYLYKNNPGEYLFQDGICERHTATACSDNPADANYDPECGSCGYVYSTVEVPQADCYAAGLFDNCEDLLGGGSEAPPTCEPEPEPEP